MKLVTGTCPEPLESASFGQQLEEWLAMRRKLLDGGATIAEVDVLMIPALKAMWPKAREEAWHYLCELCRDTGWKPTTTTGRDGQEYPAVWYCSCAKGREMEAAYQRAEQQRKSGTGRRGWSHVTE